MVEHDYYKLLGLPVGSSIEEIKKVYKDISKRLHPDTNPELKGADEYYIVLTSGYNLLSNPSKKAIYDSLLKNYYRQKEKKEHPKKYGANRNVAVKDERSDGEKAADIKDENRKFPLLVRYSLGSILILNSIAIAFNHYFINELGNDILYMMLSIFMFVVGNGILINTVYLHVTIKNLLQKPRISQENAATIALVVLFTFIPIAFLGLNKFRRNYALKNHAVEIKVFNIKRDNSIIEYFYKVDNQLIKKSIDIGSNNMYLVDTLCTVKYAKNIPEASSIRLAFEPLHHILPDSILAKNKRNIVYIEIGN